MDFKDRLTQEDYLMDFKDRLTQEDYLMDFKVRVVQEGSYEKLKPFIFFSFIVRLTVFSPFHSYHAGDYPGLRAFQEAKVREIQSLNS